VGIEGALSQGIRVSRLRRSRCIGRAKAHLQHPATAAAIDIERVVDWLAGRDREGTRMSAFVRPMTAVVPARGFASRIIRGGRSGLLVSS
jgi:hypothetical protein